MGWQPQVWCDAEVAEVRGSQLAWESSLPAQKVIGVRLGPSGNSDSQVD